MADRPCAGLVARQARHRRFHAVAWHLQWRPFAGGVADTQLRARVGGVGRSNYYNSGFFYFLSLYFRTLMALHCGIVGLPNVGKSNLFNAFTKAGLATENTQIESCRE